METANNIYTPENEDAFALKKEVELQKMLAAKVDSLYSEAKQARLHDERRWLQAYHNFRGLYPKSHKFRDSEKSRVFVKITKTKVVAAFGQLIDVVFGTGKFPIGVSETLVPEGAPEYAHISKETQPGIESSSQPKQPEVNPLESETPAGVGFAGDGRTLKPGATMNKDAGVFEELEDAEIEVEESPAKMPTDIQITPAKDASRKMEKLIHDQIEESNGASELRSAIFECVLLGTGIVKGPFNYNKTLHRWTKDEETGDRKYEPIEVRVPRSEFVSIWDFFPDPNATNIEECEYVCHRHRLNVSQLRNLRNLPHFDNAEIAKAIRLGPNYVKEDYENELSDSKNVQANTSTRYEVIEYWGMMDYDSCKECGVEVPEMENDPTAEVQVNAWVCNGLVLRAVANPFLPARLPYNAFPYERNPYSFFGIGVAENMDDSQQIMNGHARLAIDNAALSGNLVFDVDTSMLEAGQDMSVYPGKVFRRQSGMPGQAIYGVKFPNTTNENMLMFDKFRQLADEQTGIPSYSHGQTGVQSMTRTASGMSMLMGAASLNIKTVVKNVDDFLLKKLGQSYYEWNMQFFEGPLDIQGDLEVKAMGTSSLMQKEVRSQRLTTLLQTIQNPSLAPYIKAPTILKELAVSMDIDPDEFMNSPEEAELAAKIIGLQTNAPTNGQAGTGPTPGGQPGAVGPNAAVPPGPPNSGPTGNGDGTIGTGNIPMSGESEFTGPAN